MPRLLTLKQSIATLEDIGFGLSDEEDDDEIDEDEDAFDLWKMDQLKDMDAEELRELMKEAEEIVGERGEFSKQNGVVDAEAKKKKKKSKKGEEGSHIVLSGDAPPKKKRKTSTLASLPVFDLVEPDFSSKPSSSRKTSTSDSSADPYGELTALTNADAQDKAAHKKSLRFHTSKIASASARREKARTGAYGGDDDIPWRDRRKEKKVPEAQRGMGGEDLNDLPAAAEEDSDMTGRGKRRRDEEEEESDESDGDGYYELVKRKSKEKKEKKKTEHEARVAAERYASSRYQLDEIADAMPGPNSTYSFVPAEADNTGPRSLTHAILSNKGLTPHRAKAVRNPRVKKRQKFEKAKKRVSSQKATFKGGVSSTGGRYDGEQSGISKVVKSVKL